MLTTRSLSKWAAVSSQALENWVKPQLPFASRARGCTLATLARAEVKRAESSEEWKQRLAALRTRHMKNRGEGKTTRADPDCVDTSL